MRYADLALLLVPAGLAIAWLCGVRGLSTRGILTALLLLAALAATLVWLGEARSFHGRYEPAHLSGGQVVTPTP